MCDLLSAICAIFWGVVSYLLLLFTHLDYSEDYDGKKYND
jgi:hypothetical protein